MWKGLPLRNPDPYDRSAFDLGMPAQLLGASPQIKPRHPWRVRCKCNPKLQYDRQGRSNRAVSTFTWPASPSRRGSSLGGIRRGSNIRGEESRPPGNWGGRDDLKGCMGLVISASPSGGAMGSDKTLALKPPRLFGLRLSLAWPHACVVSTRRLAASVIHFSEPLNCREG